MTAVRPTLSLVLAIMVLAGSVSIMSTDLYTPSLPFLVRHFASTPDIVQLTISLNLVVYGFAQLLFGPLSDRFGRRPVFLWSLLFFCLASLACTYARSIEELIIARIAQGFFASAEAVICLAVFKDLFSEQEQAKGYAIYGMAIAFTPAAAPVLGGYIHVLAGWEYNFYLITVLGLVVAGLIFRFLPETTRPDTHALRLRPLVRNYRAVLGNYVFMVHACLAGAALGTFFAFITAGPFLLIDYFGVPVQHFGYYQAAIVVAFFLGSTMANRLLDSRPRILVLNMGIGAVLVGASLLLALVFAGGLSPLTLTGAYLFISFGNGPVFAVATARAMTAVEKAGTASATFGSLEIGLSGLIAALISVFHDGTARPLGGVVGLAAGIMLALAVAANRIDARSREAA